MKKIFSLMLVMSLAFCPFSFGASDTETTVEMDSISERTAAAGVTIDGVLLKDNQVTSAGTGTIGWSVVAGANTACTATCTSACVMGVNTAATEADIVDCADATADECLCAGSS